MAAARLALLRKTTRLDITDEVGLLAQSLVAGGLIPDKAASDAIHIAVASVHKMDYLVTRNLKHITNPLILDRLRKAVHESGFFLLYCAALTNCSRTMKTTDYPRIEPDEVIAEVRRIKTALAAKHNFDVKAMTRSLQEREKKEKSWLQL
ncbi:MAG: type II toxin-antitoxin system VapC family toxin [Blastochloris sp.]|nr:type II toxin-antitoxin system VapC family toxin [Blastochloris sp.]